MSGQPISEVLGIGGRSMVSWKYARILLTPAPGEKYASPQTMAGMDGNRTHPGRLNSAPQTVLKTLVVVLNSEPALKGL